MGGQPPQTSGGLPPRHPWEEPPPAGWSSSLPDVGRELALFAGSAALAFACVRLVHVARRMGADAHGFALALDIGIWISVCGVAAGIRPHSGQSPRRRGTLTGSRHVA